MIKSLNFTLTDIIRTIENDPDIDNVKTKPLCKYTKLCEIKTSTLFGNYIIYKGVKILKFSGSFSNIKFKILINDNKKFKVG